MKGRYLHSCILILLTFCLIACDNGSGDDTDELSETGVIEKLSERYVEKYETGTFNTLETWTYNGDEALTAYSVYAYNAAGYLTGIRTYLDEGVTLDSTIDYTYDASNNRTGGVMKDAAGTTVSSFDAVYDANHHYTDYRAWEGTACIEHRSCTYNANGDYLVETYYTDEGTATVMERYECEYSVDDPSKWVREYHSFTEDTLIRHMIHTYTWSANDMYLQSNFCDDDGDRVLDDAEELSSSILYTFVNVNSMRMMKTRSCMNEMGKQMIYWVYDYDASGNCIDTEYYYLNASGALELDSQEKTYYYTHDGDLLFERNTYAYSYENRNAGSNGITSGLWSPESAHYRAD